MLSNTIRFFKHKPAASVGFLFCINSLLLGIWVASLPGLKIRLGLTDGSLGLSLLLAPAGSLLALALSSKIYKSLAVGKALFFGHIILGVVYVCMVTSFNKPVLWLALLCCGFVGCLNGIACNAVVNIIEKKEGAKFMSTCHGMYSVGGGISAGLAALFFFINIPSNGQIILVSVLIFIVLYFLRSYIFLFRQFINSDSGFAAPPAPVIGLAFICFATFIGEGCIADWSSIYLKETLHANISIASLAYAGFSIMMAVGRLNGDVWIPKIGAAKMVTGGSIIAATGFLVVVFLQTPVLAIIGFALAGIGFSCIVPVVISTAANVPGVNATTGIAAVTTGGLTGFLFGPALIGFIAEKFTLASGLGVALLLIVCSATVASQNRFLAKDGEATYLDIH
jgi:MFS family permease